MNTHSQLNVFFCHAKGNPFFCLCVHIFAHSVLTNMPQGRPAKRILNITHTQGEPDITYTQRSLE